jgi:light-regulated signal transduction histidine kinase (bacteriophytochrome)
VSDSSGLTTGASSEAWLFGIHVFSDALIGLAFLVAPLIVVYLMRRRGDLGFSGTAIAFAAFSVASALSHFMSIWNLSHAYPNAEAITRLAAALTVIPAFILLVRLIPAVMELPRQKELSEANDALVRANAELEAFTASVSHDLRAPLSTIAGQAGLLELALGPRASDDERRRLQRIQQGTKQMAELIDALLALSRLSRYTLQKETIDASRLSQSIGAELQQRDAARSVQITIAPGLTVWGDRRLLTNVFSNLIGNAWKFTSRTADATIEVGQHIDGNGTTFFVRDNGAGFDMNFASKLFQPFQRLHQQTEFAGTGIGLATVARIIERHGGRIWAESRPNQGAAFFFTLPAMTTSERAQRVRVTQQ